MTKRFMNPNGQILVPVNLDESGEQLLRAASALAQRTGLSLAVIHVSEYWVGRTWPTEMMLGGPMGGLVSAIEDDSRELATKRLAEMVKKNVPTGRVTTEVLLGYPAESIRAHATSIGAELIVIGGAADNYRFVPRGLSTVLSLMADAPCPVLVMPRTDKNFWSKEKLKIVLADDLQAASDGGVIIGYEWATALGKATLRHIHVNQMCKDDLGSALNSAAAAAHLEEGALDLYTVWNASLKTLRERLSQRAPGRKHLVEARGGTVTTDLLEGDPVATIQKYVETEDADLIVFGKHRTWRHKPFAIGQLPFHSMLQSKRPILITEH